MKSRSLLLFGLFFAASLRAQPLLSDTFSGPALDATTWVTILPTGSSSVTQADGSVTTTGRGILATLDSFSAPYAISGSFTMLSDLEHFHVLLRSNLSESSFYERPGIFISFSNDGDEISIQRYTSSSDWDILAGASFALTTGQTYSFSVSDTGSHISLSFDDSILLDAATTYSTGAFIGFYSREFTGVGTAIHDVSVSAIPEPSTYAIVLGLASLGACAFVRKKPNQALQPTRMLGTSAAEQPLVPSTRVADL